MPTVVMTGGTSGLGRIAAQQIGAAPNTRLLLGARSGSPDVSEPLPLDLRSLDSVREFAAMVMERLDGEQIDVLALNAGALHSTADERTPEGYESTFVVNHLAHYLLLRLLLGHLSQGARVILTTSGTHDPAEGAGLPTPRHADVRLLANPELDRADDSPGTAGKRAYAASKLCNVLTARALGAVPEAKARQVMGLAFCPGQTPGTGLVRAMPLRLRLAWRFLLGPIQPAVPTFNSKEAAGRAQGDLVIGQVSTPPVIPWWDASGDYRAG
jgi:NAD(P)-dependent dehydrogenase (short-subunit alcohol dehydrogenase family)